MKISKLILFSYIGLLATAFLVFVIVLLAADKEYARGEGKYSIIRNELPEFKYIHVDNQNISLLNDDSNFYSAAVQERDSVTGINYSVSNDTLYIKPTNNLNRVSIHMKKNPNLYLFNINSDVDLNSIVADTLFYNGVANSQLDFISACEFDMAYTNLNNSRFYAYQGAINEMDLKAENSKVNIQSKMSSVKAKISDNSDVRLYHCGKIVLEKDETSKFQGFP